MKNTNIKKSKTFSLSDNVYKEFVILADKLAINKSKFVENSLKDFIRKNKKLVS